MLNYKAIYLALFTFLSVATLSAQDFYDINHTPPSFVREALSYEIARNYMPAGRANFAKLYINDEYWGLYTNVEAVNKDFLGNHFQSTDGAFFKCNPNELELFGENANLSNSPGTDIANYSLTLVGRN